MDRARFDDLARSLAAHRTRRQAVKSAGALALGGALGRLAAPESARAAVRRAAQCPLGEQIADNSTYDSTNLTHAQTFKPSKTGQLRQVTVVVNSAAYLNTTGDYRVQIHRLDASGKPDLTRVLAEATVPSAGLPAGQNTITATFAKSTAPKLKASKRYAVAVSLTDSSRWVIWHRSNSATDSCPNSQFWIKFGAADFQKDDQSDLVFAIFVAA